MGLGSQEDKIRNQIRHYAGKNDWKATIKTTADAQKAVDMIKNNLAQDPNGKLLMITYVQDKINMLSRYIKDVGDKNITLKEYLSGEKR